MSKRTRVPVMLAVLALALSGCATTAELNPVGAFATAAESLSAEARTGLDRVNQSFVERNVARIAAGEQELSDAALAGLLDESPGFIAAREALDALGRYAGSLKALASADYASEIDSAAADLYGALSSVNASAASIVPDTAKISSADLGVLATAVKGIGTAVARERQMAAVTRAVIVADGSVRATCTGMTHIFTNLRSTYVKNLDIVYTATFNAYRDEAPKLSFGDRIRRLRDLEQTKRAIRNADDFLGKIAESATALGAAHGELRASLTGTSVTPDRIVRTIGALQALAADLKHFNSTLTPAER